MHRLCYYESDDALYFGAEAKAILAVRPELREADPRGIGELVACSCVLENRTIYREYLRAAGRRRVELPEWCSRKENDLIPAEGVGKTDPARRGHVL